MPRLLDEMKQGLQNAEARSIREFLILHNRKVQFSSTKRRFVYYKEDHQDLMEKIDILENRDYIYVTHVTEASTPIYRMREEFVELLLSG